MVTEDDKSVVLEPRNLEEGTIMDQERTAQMEHKESATSLKLENEEADEVEIKTEKNSHNMASQTQLKNEPLIEYGPKPGRIYNINDLTLEEADFIPRTKVNTDNIHISPINTSIFQMDMTTDKINEISLLVKQANESFASKVMGNQKNQVLTPFSLNVTTDNSNS